MKTPRLLSATLCAALIAFGGSAIADDDDRGGARRLAGAYLAEIQVLTINGFDCPFLVSVGAIARCDADLLMSLHGDGTVETSDQTDFADGFDSQAAGSWRRKAPRAASIRTLSLGFDPEGVLQGTQIRTMDITFSGDRSSFAGNSRTIGISADQDPLDPAATLDFEVIATISGRRI